MDLIEISGEDDSLLSHQLSPLVSNNSPYFSCSPLLQIPRSTDSLNPTLRPAHLNEITKDKKDIKDHNVDRENVNANKSEALKLSVEPQQMKKKKKGGGYNLRKSLAWDKAFSTEGGVLDAFELSMLSGKTLSVIHEGQESLSSVLGGPRVSPGPRALRHNLFKELPSSSRNEGSKVAGKMSPKLMYSVKAKTHPASPAKRKVLSAHDIYKSSSKGSGYGYPRSLASSSLKRISKANATNVTTNEPRVSKQLDTKNKPLVVSTTSRSSVTSSSHTKRNSTSQPATGQKSIGIRGISSSAKGFRNDAKSGPAEKLIKKSTAQPVKTMLKVAAEQEINSSTDLQLGKVNLAINSSEGLPAAVVPQAADPLNGYDSNSRKHAASLPQTTCYYDENMEHAQTQIAKPSGLRQPSPSLGFFGQSKHSNPHSELQKGPQSCNFPTVNKVGALNSVQRPPRPSRKIPTCSVPSLTSTMNDASCGIIKSESELSDIQKVALLLQVNSESSDIVNSEKQLPDPDLKSSNDGGPCEKVEKLSCTKNIGLKINDIKLPAQSGPCEQLEKDDAKIVVDVCPRSKESTGAGLDLPHSISPIQLLVEVEGPSKINNTFAKQQVEDRKCEPSMESYSVSPESHTVSMNNDPDHISSEVHGEQLSGLDEFELSPQQAELKKPGTCRVDPISEMQSQRLETLMEDCRSSKKGVKDYISKAADNVLEVQDCGAVSYCPTHITEAEPTKDETSGTNCLNGGLHVGEVQMLSVESTLLVGSCKSSTHTSAADSNWMILDSPSAESAKQTEVLNSCSVTEQVSQHNFEPPSKGCLEYGKYSEAGPSETKDTLAKQVEDRKCKPSTKSYSVSPQPHTETMKNNWDKTGSEVNGEQLSGLDEFELSPQQEELKKPVTCRIDPISDMQSQRRNGTLMGDCTSPEKSNKDYISNAVDYALEVQDQGAHSTEAERTKDETSETDCLNGGLHVGEVQMLSVEATLLGVSCKSSTNKAGSNLIIIDSPSARSAEQTEVLNSCFVTEEVFQNNCEPPSKSFLQHGKCSEVSEEKDLIQSVNNSESRASDLFCSLASVDQDCNFAASGKLEYQHVENAFTASVDNEPLVGNFRHNVEICGEANAMELNMIYKSDIIGEIIINNVLEEKNCLDSAGDIGTKHENSDVIAKISCSRVDVASGMNGMSLHGVIDKQSDPSEENFFFPELQPEASYSPEKETVVLHSDCSTDMREHDAELQNLDLVIEQVRLENAGLCLDDNLLLINTCIESQGEDAVKNVPSESESLVVDVNVVREVDYHSTRPSSKDFNDSNYHELDNQSCPFNLSSSSNSDCYQISSVANYESKCGSLDEKIIGASSGSNHQNVREPYDTILPSEAEINIHQSNGSFDSELIDGLCSDIATLSLNKSDEDKKQDTPAIEPPPNAVPFSDEWLAALEAAGEEILAKKCGAVQNSPTDKSSPEPNPWSPVKRKNNQGLGPFDCTKCTNPAEPSSTSD
ncbi:uncharacterized protein [Euphorbia lathyris]|uniref:uncharacterized protein n=1 Tax=Euphorbia lathyris TaxID=212925 RepID=UPI0033130F7B